MKEEISNVVQTALLIVFLICAIIGMWILANKTIPNILKNNYLVIFVCCLKFRQHIFMKKLYN